MPVPKSPRSPQSATPPRKPRIPRLTLSPIRPRESVRADAMTTRRGDPLPPFVRWDVFLSSWVWKSGEHLTTIGPTGSGKTVLNRYLLRRRRFVVVLGVKHRDPELYGPFQSDWYKLERTFNIDQ